MSEIGVRVAVDAMGGDHAPGLVIEGALMALRENPSLKLYLTGAREAVERELAGKDFDRSRLELVDAPEVIEMAEPPVMAIRNKKNSSIVRGMNLVKEGTCDAFVSAGSTGAILVGGTLLIGRIKGVERAPIAALIPTEKGMALLLDSGANVDSRASHLVQFAKMGYVYMKESGKTDHPRVAIVNIGAEEEKGNALVKETYPLLKACPEINFVGSIEARDITAGFADVIVCEGFTGNVILKLMEGTAKSLLHVMKSSLRSSLSAKLGALLSQKALREGLREFDPDQYGGAPLLGLKGLVVKAHGSSKAETIKRSILQCVSFGEMRVNDKIKQIIQGT